MSREISLHVVIDNEPFWLTGLAARAMGDRTGKRDGIVVGGCGMDMGFAVVNDLSIVLHCPAGAYTHEGAYALKQEWI
jgi:hypothetical protein